MNSSMSREQRAVWFKIAQISRIHATDSFRLARLKINDAQLCDLPPVFECMSGAIHSFASRTTVSKASRSLRPNEVPLRHRLMLTDSSTSSDEPLISFCRLPLFIQYVQHTASAEEPQPKDFPRTYPIYGPLEPE